jgi:phosphatidylinositol glycan class B
MQTEGALQMANDSTGMLKPTTSVRNLRFCFFFAAIACLLRPTNGLIWVTLGAGAVYRLLRRSSLQSATATIFLLVREAIISGAVAIALSVASDRLYFGEWTFPPYHWLHFNISKDLAVFYGVNRPDYYFTEGLPLLLTTYLPFAIAAIPAAVGLWRVPTTLYVGRVHAQLASIVLAMVTALSTINHKEVRFIYPLLPMLHILIAPYFASFFTSTPVLAVLSPQFSMSSAGITKLKKVLLSALIISNVVNSRPSILTSVANLCLPPSWAMQQTRPSPPSSCHVIRRRGAPILCIQDSKPGH